MTRVSSDFLLKPGQNKKGQKTFQLHHFLNTFVQQAAEKKYSKNSAAGNFFGPSYFVTALVPTCLWKETCTDVHCMSSTLKSLPVHLGKTATAKWALTFRMWWSFSHGTFSPRKGKQLCCSLGFPPGLHFQLLVNIAIWLQLFLVMIRSLVPAF